MGLLQVKKIFFSRKPPDVLNPKEGVTFGGNTQFKT
jgi:hypothetical protein